MKVAYPKHNHPHGPENTPPNDTRVWVCEECSHVFTDAEIRQDISSGKWGHDCKNCSKGYRCESHLEPYVPDVASVEPQP